TLKLTNSQTGQKYEVQSGAAGAFEFVGLTSGTYDFEGSKPGFRETKSQLTVAGRSLQRTVNLQVGSLEETIRVRQPAAGADSTVPAGRRGAAAPPKPACVPTADGGRILQPMKIADVRPVYPASASASNASGVVRLNATIATDGTIREVHGADPSAPPDLVN